MMIVARRTEMSLNVTTSAAYEYTRTRSAPLAPDMMGARSLDGGAEAAYSLRFDG